MAIVACTGDGPHASALRVWDEGERVDPSDVAAELRAVWGRYSVREFLCSEHDWSWVLLELAEEGLPITKVPRSPQRLSLQWQTFADAITEKRLTHAPDPVLARHAANLSLIIGPSGLRPRPGRRRGRSDRGGTGMHGRLRRPGEDRACPGTDGGPSQLRRVIVAVISRKV